VSGIGPYRTECEAKKQISEAIERLGEEGKSVGAEEQAAPEQQRVEDITYQLRRKQSRPLMEQFCQWLEKAAGEVLPKSPIGEANSYVRSNWMALTRFLDAGFLSIDNNAAAHAMRPIAVGLKNWLHLGSNKGGRTAAAPIRRGLSRRGRPDVFGQRPEKTVGF
jgi:hypothetical protein